MMAMYFDRKDDFYFIKWSKQVKIRDRFTCQVCDRRGLYIEAHHMNSWDIYTDERYDLDNGVTLCGDCHKQFHEIYGYGHNTRIQFDEFVKFSEALKLTVERQLTTAGIVQQVLSDLDGYQ